MKPPTPNTLEGPPDQEFTLHWSDQKIPVWKQILSVSTVVVVIIFAVFVLIPICVFVVLVCLAAGIVLATLPGNKGKGPDLKP